jgi:hypothetical protein
MRKFSQKSFVLLPVIFALTTGPAQSVPADFGIKDIRFQVYDNQHNKLSEKSLNPYGNDMDILVSVYLFQNLDKQTKYKVKLEAFGKGRSNEAEGLVEDYKINLDLNTALYFKGGKYLPFFLPYPCTQNTEFKVTVTSQNNQTVQKKISKAFGCDLN